MIPLGVTPQLPVFVLTAVEVKPVFRAPLNSKACSVQLSCDREEWGFGSTLPLMDVSLEAPFILELED